MKTTGREIEKKKRKRKKNKKKKVRGRQRFEEERNRFEEGGKWADRVKKADLKLFFVLLIEVATTDIINPYRFSDISPCFYGP